MGGEGSLSHCRCTTGSMGRLPPAVRDRVVVVYLFLCVCFRGVLLIWFVFRLVFVWVFFAFFCFASFSFCLVCCFRILLFCFLLFRVGLFSLVCHAFETKRIFQYVRVLLACDHGPLPEHMGLCCGYNIAVILSPGTRLCS